MSTQTAPTRKTDLMTLQQCAEESGRPYTSWRDLVLSGHLERVPFGDSRRYIVRRKDYERIVNGR